MADRFVDFCNMLPGPLREHFFAYTVRGDDNTSGPTGLLPLRGGQSLFPNALSWLPTIDMLAYWYRFNEMIQVQQVDDQSTKLSIRVITHITMSTNSNNLHEMFCAA